MTYDIKGLKTYLEYTGLIAPLDRLTARADSGTRTNKFPADYTEHSVFFLPKEEIRVYSQLRCSAFTSAHWPLVNIGIR